jgi:hypothetical protein
MRASPAFQVTVRRFGVWRVALAFVIAAAAAAIAAWVVSADQASAWPARVAVIVAAGVLLVTAASLMRCSPLSLRWDTHTWHLGPASTMGEEPWSGQLAVALDLGPWLLLRFRHEPAPGQRRRITWVPVQRLGLEPHWHALRCAVYCARPADRPAGGLNAAIRPESQE